MNERLVNIVKRRGGRKGFHEGGVGEEGYEERRDMGGSKYTCTRVHIHTHATHARAYARTRTAEFNVCVTAGCSRNGGGAEIYIMFIMLT